MGRDGGAGRGGFEWKKGVGRKESDESDKGFMIFEGCFVIGVFGRKKVSFMGII